MAMENTSHVFTSLYTFSEEAKVEIREKLYNTLAASDVRLEFDQDDIFTLVCPKEDKTSFLAFSNLMKSFISSELERQPEMFEEIKVRRLADTQTETIASQEEIFSAENARQPDLGSNDDTDPIESLLLIPHETFSRDWSTNFSDQPAGANINEKLLAAISSLTGCRVEPDPDGKNVTIKGEDNEQIKKALSKLDVVDRWIHRRSQCPRKYDFQNSEGELDIMLMMQTLKNVKDRRLQTTLIPPDEVLSKKMKSFMTVIMVKEGIEVLVTPSGRPSQVSLKDCLLWKDHLFKPHGDETKEEYTPPLSIVSPTHPAAAQVGRWVDQSTSEVLDNPFSPPELLKEVPSLVQEVVAPPQNEPAPPVRKRYGKTRKTPGGEVKTKSVVPESASANPREIPAIAESNALSQEFLGPELPGNSNSHPKVNAADVQRSTSTSVGSQSVLINEHIIKPPPIEPPYMPAEPVQNELTGTKLSSQGDYPRKGHIWAGKFAAYSPLGDLVDVLPLGSKPKETVRKEDEVGSRQLQQTMNQRKSASHFGAAKGSFIALIKDYEHAMHDLLGLARAAQGPVCLRVEIGRILINHLSGSSDFKQKPFAPGDWVKAFPREGKSRLATVFTNMLTSSIFDAHSILNLVLPSGRPMISAVPTERRTTYRFDCTTKSKDRVIVEIDENGGSEVRCNEFMIGSLNWHFPKRYWDARLVVNSFEPLSSDIRSAAQELVNNLQVQPCLDQKSININTKIENGDLVIKSILLCRETRHNVPEYRDITFHLSEMQELSLSPQSESKPVYEASLPPSQPSNRSQWCKTWWEVAFSSKSASETFKKNDGLELGEESTWTAQDVIGKEVVKDLSYVTRDLVERIDFVGLSNKGPKGGSGAKTSDREKPSTEAYW